MQSFQLRLEKELREEKITLQHMQNPLPGLNYRQVKQDPTYSTDVCLRRHCDNYFRTLNRVSSLELTLDKCSRWNRRQQSSKSVMTESGVMDDESSVTTTQIDNRENVVDLGGEPLDEIKSGDYAPLAVGQMNDLDMSAFLARPLAVTSFATAPGSNMSYNVDIWDYFTSHPSVRAKLRNYAYLRGKMHIRVTISGSPFHYGKVLVSYQPLAGFNDNLGYLGPQLATGQRFAALSYLSQSKFAGVMDIKENKPIEIECPFICPQPMLRLFNKSPLILPDTGSFNDCVGLGSLYVESINTVECASATPTSVSVFVYAYMTDVELGAPTGSVMAITTEAKGKRTKKKKKGMTLVPSESKDEREEGPIEHYAMAASEIAEALMDVPFVEPFAKASSMVLKGVGSLASLFGYSVPTMINEPSRVKNQPFQNGVQLIGYDTGKRITLDPKQELTIDPRCAGSSEDEMTIAALCERESLLDTFSWADGTTPLSTSMWMAPINPAIAKRIATGAPTPYLVTPSALGFAAQPFNVWRGDILLRFEIVCSAYHRGKLAFYFEPNISQNVVIDTTLDMNKQYIKIIDIQETQDITLRIKWAFPRAWARVLPNSLLGDLGQVAFLGDALFDYANGYIAVTPFTALQSPDGSDISVNVYISSDNMRFNQLITSNLPTIRPTTESGRLSPHEITEWTLNESTADFNGICEEHYGEFPVSFRSLLKRFTQYGDNQAVTVTANHTYVNLILQTYPAPFPSYSGTSGSLNLLGYLRYAYVGLRGGLRRRMGLLGRIETNGLTQTKVIMLPPSDTAFASNFGTFNSLAFFASFPEGSVTFVPTTNGGIEYEIPFYTNNLFGISFQDDLFPTTSIIDDHVVRNLRVVMGYTNEPTLVSTVCEIATGEDFSLICFQGAPAYLYS